MKKTVLLTGAGSGLGKEAAIALARRGHKVLATVHYEAQTQDLITIARQENLDLTTFCLDILKAEDRNKILDYSINVFICNAAIGDSGSVADIDLSRIRTVFETNIFANLELVQLYLKKSISSCSPSRIIFLSSLAGRIPMAFLSPYCASKAAIEVFVTCLKKELKLLPNACIEVGCIEPGAYATGFNKENNEKKYTWMPSHSYFSPVLNKIHSREKKIWNFLEQKPYTSIIRCYIHAVEDIHLKHRYSAPWWQTFATQLGRILGM